MIGAGRASQSGVEASLSGVPGNRRLPEEDGSVLRLRAGSCPALQVCGNSSQISKSGVHSSLGALGNEDFQVPDADCSLRGTPGEPNYERRPYLWSRARPCLVPA